MKHTSNSSNGKFANVFNETFASVTATNEEWRKFLLFSSHFVKYDFDTQLLIYAQQPTSTACATMKVWNERCKRSIRRGAKGIGVFSNNGNLTYLFDIKDTEAQNGASVFSTWTYNDISAQKVLLPLIKNKDMATSFSSSELLSLIALENSIQNENCPGASQYKECLSALLHYRCNIDYNNSSEINLPTLNNEDMLLFMAQLYENAKRILGKIEIYIKNWELSQERLANVKILSETGIEKGVGKNENPLYRSERIPSAKPQTTIQTNEIREVWQPTRNISKDRTSFDVSTIENTIFTQPSSLGDRQSSEHNARPTNDRLSQNAKHKRAVKRGQPDSLGTSNEQYKSPSRGNNLYGADIQQLSLFFPSQYEQKETITNNIKAEALASALFLVAENTEIPATEPAKNARIDFSYSTASAPVENAKTRCNNNLAVIKTLQLIEAENRLATIQEQEILSKYVGWGGLSEVFDDTKSEWTNEYIKLKSLLSDDEYNAARASTLTSFYTPPEVIRSIYKALDIFGVKKGKILEPALGIGSFIGHRPNNFQTNNFRYHGIEIDTLSGRIAKQLYQNTSIDICGFEHSNLTNDFDCAIGNVPFGAFKVVDKDYNKLNFLIHDYFFAKTIDKVKPGGIIAFITSKGTLDKKRGEVRRYISQRCELIGAIRLPNNAFKQQAGTPVTSDIIFLQKREHMVEKDETWIHVNNDENNIPVNEYYLEHPEMIIGHMEIVSGPHGPETTCMPNTETSLEKQLNTAVSYLHATFENHEVVATADITTTIPSSPDVKNFSYTLIDEKIYFRENAVMNYVDLNNNSLIRMKALLNLRDKAHEIIDYQLANDSDAELPTMQNELNKQYDSYYKKYGRLSSPGNNIFFKADSSYALLCALEVFDDEGNFTSKSAIFTKRTIGAKTIITSVENASEALALSLAEKACVDIDYMKNLLSKTKAATLIKDLSGIIFKNPENFDKYETADEYLSGNVRQKLSSLKIRAAANPTLDYSVNITALEKVQPKELEAQEIDVRIGATWVPTDIMNDFMVELLDLPPYVQMDTSIAFSSFTSNWNITHKNAASRGNVKSNVTYGTSRMSALYILEDCLNLRTSTVWDKIINPDGTEKREVNKQETMLAQQKQESIREAFKEWIFKDAHRRARICKIYNEQFNSVRPREFDGSHITLPGLNNSTTLLPYQKNAVARILYGKTTLLAHVVGAGKTYSMVCGAMESKRLGLCNKSLIVVPNHLTEQWGSKWLELYPGANILIAQKSDFEKANRKKFCGRIATGDYDAIIIGHSQFEKIPLSAERQAKTIEKQIDDLTWQINVLKKENAERFTVKQTEKTKKSLQTRLEKLNSSLKDDVVTFEELGVDRLYVDEAHNYKNLFLYTKMRNVAGIAQTEAMKSSDMFSKCRYLDEITGGRGTVFATGTPISNSMTELYTMMRYLQYNTLEQNNLIHFDSWASTFGETVTAIELAPEGTGYRSKTRFAKFYNLPELMSLWKESADIQTAEMLNLPVPALKGGKPINIVIKPSKAQQDYVKQLADRAEAVHNRTVEPTVDNMLKITNDGRKLALDQRLINPLLLDEPNSKVNICANNVFNIWKEYFDEKLTQLVFCDLSTPKSTDEFNVYDALRSNLISQGIPENDIYFIHDANTDAKKAALFAQVRSGKIRVLIGSTAKMGAGTNVQEKLVALHHLDVPWRPSDIEQREGRIIRQGNQNKEIAIYRYVTEGTFDAYSWQLIENKQKFISQVMTGKSSVRSCDDLDETSLSFAEVKALATGNPLIKEKMDLDISVARLKLLKANHTSQKFSLENSLIFYFPKILQESKNKIKSLTSDVDLLSSLVDTTFQITIDNILYDKTELAGTALLSLCEPEVNMRLIGNYRGFNLFLNYHDEYRLSVIGAGTYSFLLGGDAQGNIVRLNNVLNSLQNELSDSINECNNIECQIQIAQDEIKCPFSKEKELNEKIERLNSLNALLSIDNAATNFEYDISAEDDFPKEKAENLSIKSIVQNAKSNMTPSLSHKNNVLKEER